jgi:hypothetical protein
MADDGEVRLVAAEIDGCSPEIDDVQQGDQAEDESVRQSIVAQGNSLQLCT